MHTQPGLLPFEIVLQDRPIVSWYHEALDFFWIGASDVALVNIGQPWRASVEPLIHDVSGIVLGISCHNGMFKSPERWRCGYRSAVLCIATWDILFHLAHGAWRDARYAARMLNTAVRFFAVTLPLHSLAWRIKKLYGDE